MTSGFRSYVLKIKKTTKKYEGTLNILAWENFEKLLSLTGRIS